MAYMRLISSTTPDPEILAEIGRRLRELRGSRDQREVAAAAGLNRETVGRAERGANPTLLTLIRLLRVYGRLGALESFIPDADVSPMLLLRESKRRSGDSAHG